MIFYNLMFKYLIVVALFAAGSAVLMVYDPPCAVSRFTKKIQYTLSNFGEIPYGQTIIGQIKLPNDPLLCKTAGETFMASKDPTFKNIMLVKRGTCKFTEKVINAQKLGADVIIIYDSQPGEMPSVIMKNDGHGHLAQIASLFISNKDGLNLLTTDKDCPKLPVVKILFEIDQAERSQVTLWLDANNRESYILARDFYKNDYYEAIQDRIDLNIRFRIQNTCEDWICSKDDCVGTLLQKYCRNVIKTDNSEVPTVKGHDLISEQLREYFLWEQLKPTDDKLKWWRYMTQFDHSICLEKVDVQDCSYNTMRYVQISQFMITNIKQKVVQTFEDLKVNKNNILKQSYEQSKQMGVFFYPEATINNRNFYGLFKAPEVFQTICNSLIDPPSECVKFIKQNHEEENEGSGLWKTILIILFLMTLGFLVALFVYTRIIRNEVNQQLSVEVNKMVENYVNMSASSTKKSSAGSYSKFDS